MRLVCHSCRVCVTNCNPHRSCDPGDAKILRWAFESRNSGVAAIDEVTIMDEAAGEEDINDDNSSKPTTFIIP